MNKDFNMSEHEVEVDAAPPEASIEDLINSISDKEFNQAGETFSTLLGDRIQDALEQQRIAVAAQYYGSEESSEDEVFSELEQGLEQDYGSDEADSEDTDLED